GRYPERERRDERSAKVLRWANKPASSQCNVRLCETRYSTAKPRFGQCGQIHETLTGSTPPSFCNYRSLLAVRGELVEQIKEMDRRLRIIANQSQACEILMTIPGVGVQTSAAFAAAVDEAGRFRQSRNAGAYFGLVPRRHQSGEIDWTGRITKQGDGTVRKLLYEAANSILTRSRESFALKTWALKIAKRRGLKKARVALARRLAVIMHAMLRDGTLFQA